MNNSPIKLFWHSHFFMLFILCLWFSPVTHPFYQWLDNQIFYHLNANLKYPLLQNIFGVLNHRRETIINLIGAMLISLCAILVTRDPNLKRQRIKQTLFFWIFFEIGFQLQDWFFNHWLIIKRLSPSLVLKPVIKLSQVLQNPAIKDTSTSSFPSGHAFAMIYWGSFNLIVAPRYIGLFGIIFASFFCLPRLFSGAHWFSDILFSVVLALNWLSWTLLLEQAFKTKNWRTYTFL